MVTQKTAWKKPGLFVSGYLMMRMSKRQGCTGESVHWPMLRSLFTCAVQELCNAYRTPCTFSKSNASTEIHQPCLPFSVQLIMNLCTADNESEMNQWELTHHRLANTAPLTAAILLNLEIISTFPMTSQLQGELHNILAPSFSYWRMLDVCEWYLQHTQQISASKSHQAWKYFFSHT